MIFGRRAESANAPLCGGLPTHDMSQRASSPVRHSRRECSPDGVAPVLSFGPSRERSSIAAGGGRGTALDTTCATHDRPRHEACRVPLRRESLRCRCVRAHAGELSEFWRVKKMWWDEVTRERRGSHASVVNVARANWHAGTLDAGRGRCCSVANIPHARDVTAIPRSISTVFRSSEVH